MAKAETKMGRPTKYQASMAKKALEYVDGCKDVIEDYHKTQGVKSDTYERLVHVNIPTVEGLAKHLGVSRATIFNWEKEVDEEGKPKHPDFLDSLGYLNEVQKSKLVEGALGGHYNPTIAKLILSANHDVVEKKEVDMTSGGEPIQGFNYIDPDGNTND